VEVDGKPEELTCRHGMAAFFGVHGQERANLSCFLGCPFVDDP